jgi:hypothetical protein
VTKCAEHEGGAAEPRFEALRPPPGLPPAPELSAFGAGFRRWREARR